MHRAAFTAAVFLRLFFDCCAPFTSGPAKAQPNRPKSPAPEEQPSTRPFIPPPVAPSRSPWGFGAFPAKRYLPTKDAPTLIEICDTLGVSVARPPPTPRAKKLDLYLLWRCPLAHCDLDTSQRIRGKAIFIPFAALLDFRTFFSFFRSSL